MNRKIFAKTVAMAGAAVLGLIPGAFPVQAQEFGPPELIAAAKAEGKLVFYTENFAEIEQLVIKQFNKRFPEIKVEMVRAPGGQLITRVKTEAAAGKLIADVIDHSDRGLMLPMEDMFQDYAPPNAADYNPEALISKKLWPRATIAWSIAYNTELVKDPPKTWMDLTKRGLLEEAGCHSPGAVSVGSAGGGRAGSRRSSDGSVALQCDLPEEKGRCAG